MLAEAEVWAALEADSLTLVPSSCTSTGFKGVILAKAKGKGFIAQMPHEGKLLPSPSCHVPVASSGLRRLTGRALRPS